MVLRVGAMVCLNATVVVGVSVTPRVRLVVMVRVPDALEDRVMLTVGVGERDGRCVLEPEAVAEEVEVPVVRAEKV